MLAWLQHVLGLDNGSGGWYLFWSGFGANFQELAIVVGVLHYVRKANCHQHGCWRVGRHPLKDQPAVKLCRKHHPEGGHRG